MAVCLTTEEDKPPCSALIGRTHSGETERERGVLTAHGVGEALLTREEATGQCQCDRLTFPLTARGKRGTNRFQVRSVEAWLRAQWSRPEAWPLGLQAQWTRPEAWLQAQWIRTEGWLPLL
ncbi:unnamed protein product [Arctogadus glacialis]